MITRRLVFCGLLFLLAGTVVAAPAFQPLQSGSFATLTAALNDQPFLLILWSITCGPCRDEFSLLREVRERHPQLPLVLVSTDDLSDEAVAAQALRDFGMTDEESWIFADDSQKLRYEIDPNWYGELPRAYFYDAAHRRKGVSGKLSRQQIESWLADNVVESSRP